MIKLFEGNFLGRLNDLAQESGNSPQVPCPRSVLSSAPLEVVYEDLVKDPETVVTTILDYCGLEWSPKCLEFHNTRRLTITASSYQVKLPFYTRSIGRWQNYQEQIQPLLDVLEADGYVKSGAASESSQCEQGRNLKLERLTA